MGLLKLVVILGLVAAGAAFFTKPGPQDVDSALREALYQRLFTTEIEAGREILGNALIIACRIEPQTCYEVLREGLDITYEDRVLYARVAVEGFGRRADCLGAFTRFACPGGFAPLPRG